MSTTGFTLGELVERCGGQLLGSPDIFVTGIAPLAEAQSNHISFLANPKLRKQVGITKACALILNPKDHLSLESEITAACILTENPYAYFAHAAQLFASLTAFVPPAGVHARAYVGTGVKIAPTASIAANAVVEDGAVIGERSYIGAGAVIGRGVSIGDDTVIHANATIYEHCIIGDHCCIHSGAVIGADGFGFANEKGRWIKIPQTGRVIVGNHVEIGANTTIDRGAMNDTIIEDGVILDNQIQIGHNCHIGENTAMAGCVGVAGSAKIGRNCTFGGAAMVLGHLSIVDNVHISSGSMVSRSINEPGQYTGFYPLAKNADWEKSAVLVRNLAQLRDKVRELEKTIHTLTQNQNEQS